MPQNPSRVKKKGELARLERRVRVTFFLVAHRESEIEAVDEVIDYLTSQYLSLFLNKEWELPITGFTHSAVHDITLQKDPIFIGRWWSDYITDELPEITLSKENVVLFIVDLPAIAEEWKTDENIAFLKTKIFEFYKMFGSPQEEIWMVKQDIYRYA